MLNETFEIDIAALNDDEFDIEYREGDKYIFHGKHHETKFWNEAENHCREQNGHLVSIRTNHDFKIFSDYQRRQNGKGKGKWVWLGGSDDKVESVWEWSDGSPWANESVPSCKDVSNNVQKSGVKDCTNWETYQPAGGKDRNCLIADQSQRWQSKDCMERFPYWCQFPPTRLEGTKIRSWSLADITFSKIELWFTQKAEGGGKACNSNSKMPGFSITWSTKAGDGSSLSEEFVVPKILRYDARYYDKGRVEKVFNFFNHGLQSIIVACREVNLTTQEIWEIVKSLKREMVEGNDTSCNLGNMKSEDFQKLLTSLETKIPKSHPKVT